MTRDGHGYVIEIAELIDQRRSLGLLSPLHSLSQRLKVFCSGPILFYSTNRITSHIILCSQHRHVFRFTSSCFILLGFISVQTEANAVSNIISSIQATGVPQILGWTVASFILHSQTSHIQIRPIQTPLVNKLLYKGQSCASVFYT